MALAETQGYETLIRGLIALLFPLLIIMVIYSLNRLLVKKIKIDASFKLLSVINYFLPSITFMILYLFMIAISFLQFRWFSLIIAIVLFVLQMPVIMFFDTFLNIQLGSFDLVSGSGNVELTVFLFIPLFYFVYFAVLNRIIIYISKILKYDISEHYFFNERPR